MVSCIVKLIYAQQTYQSVPRDIHRPRMQQHMTVYPKNRDAYGIHWLHCCVPTEMRATRQRLTRAEKRPGLTEEIAGWTANSPTSFFKKPACLF